jgi:Flp pilus assembly protein TadB
MGAIVDPKEAQEQPRLASVGRAWAWLLVFTGGMTVISFAVWGSLPGAPSWFHALFAFQTLWAIVAVANAYKRRTRQESDQTPV